MSNAAKEKLIKQVEKQYINLVYTRESHLKCSQRLEKLSEYLSRGQIALSAISTAGLISVFIVDNKIGTIIGAVCSALLFAISTYIKDKDILSSSKEHIKTAEKLFVLREKYETLLATCEDKTIQEFESIILQYIEKTEEVYQSALPYLAKDYDKATSEIKSGKLSVSEDDRKLLLPNYGEKNDLK